MSALDVVLIMVVGVGGGVLSALVGGASLLTYPALVAIGIPPIPAVIANLVALMPANLAAAWLDRQQLPALSRGMLALIVIYSAGAVAGAWLLLATPAGVFTALVPLLLGLSTLLFAYADRLTTFIDARAESAEAAARSRWQVTLGAMVPVAVYSGYFGAGAGVMLLAILMIVMRGQYRPANAMKNLCAGLNSLVATAVFVVQDAVLWKPAAVLTIGAIAGAMIGIRIVRIVPREVMRRAVIAISWGLTLVFAWRYWL